MHDESGHDSLLESLPVAAIMFFENFMYKLSPVDEWKSGLGEYSVCVVGCKSQIHSWFSHGTP